MYDYPIFKHLVQFSNLIDAKGNLIQEAPGSKPEEVKRSSNDRDDSSGRKREEYENEGGEQEFEGGDSQVYNKNGMHHPDSSNSGHHERYMPHQMSTLPPTANP